MYRNEDLQRQTGRNKLTDIESCRQRDKDKKYTQRKRETEKERKRQMEI
jgi:hypothetical protein